ncbi:MAG: hypothetical protein NZM31_00180 [Gemmatales bacterium]|nr:hypothetical protein [Gemmatales bacterium]MDW8385409.1 hypothetical protein [Gemmatales bacterium]
MGVPCAELLVSRILDDESLTHGLNDPEARMLIEWLVDWAECIAVNEADPGRAARSLDHLCRRARLIRRFVVLWCHHHDHAAANQFAAVERLTWPLPPSNVVEPCEVMTGILESEQSRLHDLLAQPKAV